MSEQRCAVSDLIAGQCAHCRPSAPIPTPVEDRLAEALVESIPALVRKVPGFTLRMEDLGAWGLLGLACVPDPDAMRFVAEQEAQADADFWSQFMADRPLRPRVTIRPETLRRCWEATR